MASEKKAPIMVQMQSSVKAAAHVDDILEIIKPLGRYQAVSTFIYAYSFFSVYTNTQFMSFGGSEPKFYCADQDHKNEIGAQSPTSDCSITYYNCTPENLTFVYDFYSIAEHWALVCDRSYYTNLITSVQMAGVLCGSFFIGPIVDWYGRKWTVIAVYCAMQAFGAASALAWSWQVFAVFRFVIGFFVGAVVVAGWVSVAETTTNRYRMLVRAAATAFLGQFNQTLIAYVTRDWRWFSIVGNVQTLPVAALLAFFTYESPRWLLQRGRVDEAEEVLRKIARFNRTEHLLPAKLDLDETGLPTVDARLRKASTSSTVSQRYYAWDLFRTSKLAVRTTVSIITWFVMATVNYGMFFGISSLPANIYVSMLLLAAVDTLELPFAFYDARHPRLNRKWLLIGTSSVTVLANAGVAVMLGVNSDGGQAYSMGVSVVSIVGQLASNIAFDIMYMYSVELFPTLLRSNAGALCSVGARIGSTIAPQLLFLQQKWAPLPYICFAAVAAVGVLVDALFLPNTKNSRLPETYKSANALL